MRGLNWEKVFSFRFSIHRVLVLISAFVLLVLMLLTAADATGRYIFLQPVRGGYDISQQLMAYVIFLGLAYVLITGGHIRVVFIVEKFPRKFRSSAQIMTDIIGLGFCIVLIWGSWVQFWYAWVSKELLLSAITLYTWPGKLAMPIGFFLMAVEFLLYLINHVRELAPAWKKS